jgi:fructose-1,6-bisphosphatase I/sedoheptulose-1,7-bisphosphatase
VLGVLPTALHQRIGLVFGSRDEVERIERYHHEPASHDSATPLFAERGLFRAQA